MGGKLKIKGNMMLARKLASIILLQALIIDPQEGEVNADDMLMQDLNSQIVQATGDRDYSGCGATGCTKHTTGIVID